MRFAALRRWGSGPGMSVTILGLGGTLVTACSEDDEAGDSGSSGNVGQSSNPEKIKLLQRHPCGYRASR